MAVLLRCFVLSAMFLVGLPAARAAEPNRLTPAELAEGWLLLFDGETTYGWKAASEADWNIHDGAITVARGAKGLLCTTTQFADFTLRLEFRADAGTNSGVFLRTPQRPKNPAGDCYEVNIAAPDVSPFPTGSLVERQRAEGVPAAAPAGDGWRALEMTAEGPRLRVRVDGVQVLDYTDARPLGRGFIGLQLNQGGVAFRNIKLKPLGLKSIFNGRDLSGWKTDRADKTVVRVTPAGELNIVNGPGQVETEGRYGDFVLQLEVFVNGKELNSGVFFRSIPGDFQMGYESQIHNGTVEGDRGRPNNGGTGGIFRRQEARRVVSDDFAWFHKAIVADGPHMAAWVNGIQVSDWTDERPPHENPRKGLRLEPGTIILQGHDPTTDLSFRNFRIGETAKR